MRSSVLLAATLALLCGSSAARADDPACSDAFERSQVKRDEGKLREARKLLRVCAAPTCSATRQKLCSIWLAEVEPRVPSLILSAKSASGADVVDVKVTIDGVEVATKLDGSAIDVDPGKHSVVFQGADGTGAETTVLAEESAKGKVAEVTLVAQAPRSQAVPASAPAPEKKPPAHAAIDGHTLKTVGVVASIAGVVGLGVGGVFGVLALATKGAHCDSSGLCTPPGSASTAYSQGTLSTVGFIAGGALLAGGLTLVLLAPSSEEHPAASVAIAPMVGLSTGGLQLAGRW